jgi:hypothetical protein
MITVEENRTRDAVVSSGSCALAAIFRSLAEQLRLQGEDVVEDAIDSPAFEAVVGDHAGPFELAPQQSPQCSINPRASANLRILEELKAAIERELPQLVHTSTHVPSTSTLPVSVTRTLTKSRCGSA